MDDSVAASVASIAATGLNPFPKIDDVATPNLDWLREMDDSVAASVASIAATGLNPFPKIDDVATPNLDWLREMDDSVAASAASIAATGLNPFPKIDDVTATNLDWLRDMNDSVAASVASLAAPNLDLFPKIDDFAPPVLDLVPVLVRAKSDSDLRRFAVEIPTHSKSKTLSGPARIEVSRLVNEATVLTDEPIAENAHADPDPSISIGKDAFRVQEQHKHAGDDECDSPLSNLIRNCPSKRELLLFLIFYAISHGLDALWILF